MAGDWFDRIPKVELHLHLEGAIPLSALWQLVGKYGGTEEVPTSEALERRFAYRDFPHFIETWHWKNRFLKEYEDFTLIAEAVARDLAGQHVRYVEAFFSPPDFARHGLEPGGLAAAIRAGLDRVPEVRVALVTDLVRDTGPANAARTLAAVAEAREHGIVGVGIGGSEQRFPPEPFAGVYDEARRLGFGTSAHAGEAAGPASIWGAVTVLRVDRIGHGTRAEEDPALVEYLATEGIPIELCPISNVRTGVVSSLETHPAGRYLRQGLRVTVNTDDPKMFGNSLAGEYRALVERCGWTRDDVRRAILNAVDVAWLDDERRDALRREIIGSPEWQSDS